MATPEVMEQFAIISSEYSQIHSNEIQRVLDLQRSLEYEIIQESNSFCPLAQIKNRTVRSEDIERALQEGFGDANVLKTLMCMNNSMLSYSSDAAKRGFRIRHYLENLTQIGGESAEGYAMTTEDKFFVTKSPRRVDNKSQVNQMHEYFVGSFGTNSLRSKIPNFAFMLGFFQCSPPYIDNSLYTGLNIPGTKGERKALTYCQNDINGNQVNYLLYENITNSKTLQKFIEDGCTFEQFLNVFIQIVLALDLAYTEFDFTHYDLHTENVLIRELPEEILISYPSQKDKIKTKYVATIIDFGRSHIKFNGQDFGDAVYQAAAYPNISYPMGDIYKILMFSLNAAAFGNKDLSNYVGLLDKQIQFTNADVFNNCKELLNYFNPDLIQNEVADYIIKTRKFYYQLPYSPEYNVRPLNFFENIMMIVYPNTINSMFNNNSGPIYGCSNTGTCYSLEQAILEYSKPTINYINDVYTFYELIKSSTNDLANIVYEGENRYESYMVQLRSDKNKYILEYNRITQGYNIVSFRTSAPDDIKFQDGFLEIYRTFIAKSVKLVDLLTSLKQIENIVKKLNEVYPEKAQQNVPGTNYKYIDIPREEFDTIRESVGGMNKVITSIKQDVVYINSLDERQVLRINYNAIWLFQKMPSLISAITKF